MSEIVSFYVTFITIKRLKIKLINTFNNYESVPISLYRIILQLSERDIRIVSDTLV